MNSDRHFSKSYFPYRRHGPRCLKESKKSYLPLYNCITIIFFLQIELVCNSVERVFTSTKPSYWLQKNVVLSQTASLSFVHCRLVSNYRLASLLCRLSFQVLILLAHQLDFKSTKCGKIISLGWEQAFSLPLSEKCF